MLTIKNEDYKLLCDIESLLYLKVNDNGTEEEKDLINKYWNFIERIAENKDKAREESRKFNKDNKEYHRLNVNLYRARKAGNKELEEKYTKLMQEYKNKKKVSD